MPTARARLAAVGLVCTLALALAAAGACSGASSIAGTDGTTSKLAFTVQPGNIAAGVAISPAVQVTIQDANGNTVTSSTASITIAIGTNSGGGTLSGTKTVSAVSGVATFSTLSIDKADTGYTLTASATGLTGSTSSTFNVNASLPAGFNQFVTTVQVTVEGTTVVVRSNGVPNHGSPYFDPSDPRFEAYNGSNPNFMLNPNRIATQALVFRIPASPTPTATPQATPLGPIGIGLNGVPIFNQYAGPNQPLTNEINSFDQYNGHPQQTGMYHFHVEPLFITASRGKSGLLGFLLDGYPVYGPLENAVTLRSADLDAYHGHSHATADYPQGIYHYHVTADAPYINGSGFYGVPGTVSN